MTDKILSIDTSSKDRSNLNVGEQSKKINQWP